MDSRMNKKWDPCITDVVKAAIDGGATIIQLSQKRYLYREKEAETLDLLEAAEACKKMCQSNCIALLINDRVDVALACDADGVHVGQSDMPANKVCKLLGSNKIIGVLCKTLEQADHVWLDGADYTGCGGVFPTTTKSNNQTIGLDGLKALCSSSKLPVVAIEGINKGNAGSVMELGVPNLKGIAVVSALFDQQYFLTETRSLHSLLMDISASTKE
ncbi:thiamine biosynthetic bifunctional enzyme TH1, chloroplastic-like [Aristolochia californica]|uniref:thiamine biosynthetic bifunctional enzyme TH1, chloroplastic-like n=1 Tax=Aristolochia californica TaxID=171875 RepID=UPI0035DC91B1